MSKKSRQELRQLFQQDSVLPSKSERYQSRRQKELDSFAEFKEQQESKLGKTHRHLGNPPKNLRKMSEVLLEFATPVLEEAEDFEDCQFCFSMAVIAWNLALLPLEDQAEFFKENHFLKNPLDKEDVEMSKFCMEMIQTLIALKLLHFGKDRRMVEDYQLTENDGDLHLS
ncbi:MAG: hypothetical protein ACKO1W_12885, partial [Microcystaceae cyanobacterium]